MHVYRRMKRHAIALLIASMMTSGWSSAFAMGQSADSKGHWAETQLSAWLNQGYIRGYEDGALRPDDAIKRGELVALINRVYQLKDAASIRFDDLSDGHWAHGDAAKAVKAGYIEGYDDNSIRVEAQVSRQELAIMVARLLKLGSSDSDKGVSRFKDASSIPEWSREAIGALAEMGIVNGYEDGSFKAAGLVTRAEAIVLLERANGANVYSRAGVYGPQTGKASIAGNVLVTASGVTLQNMVIEGDLTLGEGIGEGDVTLSNVIVKGKTRINGGGADSIHFNNTVLVQVVIDKQSGSVRIVVNGETSIEEVLVRSGAIIEADDVTGKGIGTVTLSDALPKDAQITLVGSFENVNVSAPSLLVEIPKGSVSMLTVHGKGDGTKLVVGKDASIAELILNAAAAVFGQGEIKLAIINAKGIQFEKQPGKLRPGTDVDKNAQIKIGGVDKTIEEAVKPSTPSVGGGFVDSGPGAGGSGGGGGGVGTGEPEPAAVYPQVSLPQGGSVTESAYISKQRLATVGDVVYGVSDQEGSLYLVPGATSRYISMLDIVVSDNKGIRKSVKANEQVSFSTAGLPAGDYVLIGLGLNYAMNDYRADQELRLNADPGTPLSQNSLYVYSNGKVLDIGFNKPIRNAYASMSAFKGTVSYSTYAGSVTSSTYATNDAIEIRDNVLRITFADSAIAKGTLKLAANSLKDKNNGLLAGLTVLDFDFGPSLLLKQTMVNAGGSVAVVTDRAAEVYLIQRGISVTKTDLDKAVLEGRATKAQTSANAETLLATKGLVPGSYLIVAWGGGSANITIR
ncbi:MAG: S-layer protein [Paenibacillus sp.]|nr:S-layer protein [Paenibacillus sp.]